MYKAELGF